MTLTNAQLELRILSIEEKLNEIQTALNNLATRRMVKQFAAIQQTGLSEVRLSLQELSEAWGESAFDSHIAGDEHTIYLLADGTRTATKLLVSTYVAFSAEYDNGSNNGATTINWNNGQKQKVTLDGDATFSFTPPIGGTGNFLLKVVQDGVGTRTITWPAAVIWPGGNAPVLTTDPNAVDIIAFYWDGTNYLGVSSLDFS